MIKAYSYIRMSTEIQLRGDSLRRQLELSKNYAAKHGLELVDHLDGKALQDIGVSGYRGRNSTVGALSVFMNALKTGKIAKGSREDSMLFASINEPNARSTKSCLS